MVRRAASPSLSPHHTIDSFARFRRFGLLPNLDAARFGASTGGAEIREPIAR
jgi:hypothetical protein